MDAIAARRQIPTHETHLQLPSPFPFAWRVVRAIWCVLWCVLPACAGGWHCTGAAARLSRACLPPPLPSQRRVARTNPRAAARANGSQVCGCGWRLWLPPPHQPHLTNWAHHPLATTARSQHWVASLAHQCGRHPPATPCHHAAAMTDACMATYHACVAAADAGDVAALRRAVAGLSHGEVRALRNLQVCSAAVLGGGR